MKKTLLTALALILISSSAMATYNPPCQTCPSGPQGPQGIQGEKGEPGTNGINGVDGIAGSNGKNGTNGVNGTNGEPGINGANGISGTNGTNGMDGKDGMNGTNGTNGTSYDNDKQRANIAGTMAMTRIDHAKNNGIATGIGISAFDGGEAMAIGIGKSFTSTGKIKEYVLDAAAYVGTSGSQAESGVAAGLTLHW